MRFPEIQVLNVRRFAHPFRPAVVRALVPERHPGVYLLLRDGSPIYVGRSDACSRSRLVGHPLLDLATHFSWQPCRGAEHAFHVEAFWFHALRDRGLPILNRVHPARPGGGDRTCPFCGASDLDAVRFALEGGGQPVSARATLDLN